MPLDTALVVGATGLVGSHCLQSLLESDAYERVIALSRRSLSIQHPRLTETIVDFDNPRIIAQRSATAGASQFLLVSSVGADPRSSNFYLRVKAELEKAVNA